MKHRSVLLLTTMLVLALCAGGEAWLRVQRQQYARNRQLIAALVRDDTQFALALVNAGADPDTRSSPPPAPTLPILFARFLRHTPPPVNDSSTALQLACGLLVEEEQGLDTPFPPTREDARLVQAMLAHGANVNAVQSDKATALHFAARDGRLRTVEMLLHYGANVNARNTAGWTPLMEAAMTPTANVTRLLLARGANVNAQNSVGETPLYVAVGYGRAASTVSELMTHGADPNLRAQDGETPLLLSEGGGSRELVRLLTRGAK